MLYAILAAIAFAAEPVYQMSEQDVDAFLKQQTAEAVPFAQRLETIVDATVGTTYQDGPLGEGPDGTHDTDPLIDLRRVDCVTYVEQTVAMAAAKSYPDLVNRLQRIRYKDGRVNYESRNHFMISDWVRNNPWCMDVTTNLNVPTKTVSRTISRKDFFDLVKAPELGRDTKDEVINLPVIPSDRVAEAESRLPDLALVVFVGKVDWLFSLHCGLYVRGADGKGELIHASSKGGKVMRSPLADYVKSQGDRYIGITAYKITQPEFPNSSNE